MIIAIGFECDGLLIIGQGARAIAARFVGAAAIGIDSAILRLEFDGAIEIGQRQHAGPSEAWQRRVCSAPALPGASETVLSQCGVALSKRFLCANTQHKPFCASTSSASASAAFWKSASALSRLALKNHAQHSLEKQALGFGIDPFERVEIGNSRIRLSEFGEVCARLNKANSKSAFNSSARSKSVLARV